MHTYVCDIGFWRSIRIYVRGKNDQTQATCLHYQIDRVFPSLSHSLSLTPSLPLFVAVQVILMMESILI